MFLVHGSDDIVSPPEGSVVMYLALKRAGIPAELHMYAATTHDFGVRAFDRPFAAWTVAVRSLDAGPGVSGPADAAVIDVASLRR